MKFNLSFFLVTCIFVNIFSARLSARIQVLFTAAKLMAIGIIGVGGIIMMAQGT